MHNAMVPILASRPATPAVAALLAGLLLPGAARADEEAKPAATWEGAIGLVLRHGPTYAGAEDKRTRIAPGLFLRYGRFSVTTTGGFATRSQDETTRGGLAAELVQRDDFRVSLSLRFAGGRDPGSDPLLAGLDKRRTTLRGRLGVSRDLGAGWQLRAGWNPDLLGRDGGSYVDVGLNHGWALTPTVQASAGIGATWSNARYLQSYFGVSEAESARSGHPVYRPGSGLRDVGANVGLRTSFGPRWVGFANAGVSRLVGPAADSPLTRRPSSWSLGAGLAWRF
ncbi:MipA/OmpV family protein [Aquincola sp. S2]|uniref:MipA/OmpV family protein n=1 Tax=Pseudaquabacterium terrae TaxID=2732868 RepID=A0ABX2EH98_9BURK|nr:MipA/OmpV family protein [Aquabacterium terrae]NRF67961.1 MipA/OmpV family protein [Aquabacterium terrae]